jgi:hypothetical protein
VCITKTESDHERLDLCETVRVDLVLLNMKWLFMLEQYAEYDLLFVLQSEYLTDSNPKPFSNPNQ